MASNIPKPRSARSARQTTTCPFCAATDVNLRKLGKLGSHSKPDGGACQAVGRSLEQAQGMAQGSDDGHSADAQVIYLNTEAQPAEKSADEDADEDADAAEQLTTFGPDLREAITRTERLQRIQPPAEPVEPQPVETEPAPATTDSTRQRRQPPKAYRGPDGLHLGSHNGLIALEDDGHIAAAVERGDHEQLSAWLKLAEERVKGSTGTKGKSPEFRRILREFTERLRVTVEETKAASKDHTA